MNSTWCFSRLRYTHSDIVTGHFNLTGLEIVNRDLLLQIKYADPDNFTRTKQLMKDDAFMDVD
jgi:hypothetical protein